MNSFSFVLFFAVAFASCNSCVITNCCNKGLANHRSRVNVLKNYGLCKRKSPVTYKLMEQQPALSTSISIDNPENHPENLASATRTKYREANDGDYEVEISKDSPYVTSLTLPKPAHAVAGKAYYLSEAPSGHASDCGCSNPAPVPAPAPCTSEHSASLSIPIQVVASVASAPACAPPSQQCVSYSAPAPPQQSVMSYSPPAPAPQSAASCSSPSVCVSCPAPTPVVTYQAPAPAPVAQCHQQPAPVAQCPQQPAHQQPANVVYYTQPAQPCCHH